MTDFKLREAPLRFNENLESDEKARRKDTLNLLPYAEALADLIHRCETPITIGIQGEWGIGRTTIMNMIRGNGSEPCSGLLNEVSARPSALIAVPIHSFTEATAWR